MSAEMLSIRATALHCRTLLQPPKQDTYETRLQREETRLMRSCPYKASGRQVFYRELFRQLQDGRSGAPVSQAMKISVMNKHAEKYNRLPEKRKT
eukprot:2130069-Amphidinium_carterae.1